MKRIWMVFLVMAALVVGCDPEDESDDVDDVGIVADTGDDAAEDAAGEDGEDAEDEDASQDVEEDAEEDVEEDVEEPIEPLTARDYCESTAEIFCGFYLRCGRMHAADQEECLGIFAETCERKYEPHYVAQADAGRLALSEEGIEACAAHLEDVVCQEQVSDIDGPCREMWVGLQGPGDECGPGIESLVCGGATRCRLNTSFCGECVNARQVGQTCVTGEVSCVDTAACINGECVARGLPGQACDAERPCGIGGACIDGVCELFYEIVAVGEACGQGLRCPFNSFCSDGECAVQSGIGEACEGHGACRSGYCDEVCQEFKQAGDACTAGPECVSEVCDEGECAPIGFCI